MKKIILFLFVLPILFSCENTEDDFTSEFTLGYRYPGLTSFWEYKGSYKNENQNFEHLKLGQFILKEKDYLDFSDPYLGGFTQDNGKFKNLFYFYWYNNDDKIYFLDDFNPDNFAEPYSNRRDVLGFDFGRTFDTLILTKNNLNYYFIKRNSMKDSY